MVREFDAPRSTPYTPEMHRKGFLLARYIRYLAKFKLTPYGRIIVVLTFVAAVGSITVEIPIYQIFCSLFFLAAVAEIVGTFLRPRLEIRCHLPQRATVGVPLTGRVEIENVGYFSAFDLMLGFFEIDPSIRHVDADRVISSLKAGGIAEIPFELVPSERGLHSLGPALVHSTFPFNLMRFAGKSVSLAPLTVIPAYESLDGFEVPQGHRGRPMHPAPLLASKGESPEYVGNREYVAGEPAVRLDFRAWARLGRPVVREYQDEYSFRSAVIVDTWQPRPRWPRREKTVEGNRQQIDAAVALAAAIGESMHAREIVTDLFAAGPEVYLFRSRQTSARFDTILEILASVQGTSTDPFLVLPGALREILDSIASAVVIALDWDERRQACVEELRESGIGVRVILVRSQPPTEPFPEGFHGNVQVDPRQILAGEVRWL